MSLRVQFIFLLPFRMAVPDELAVEPIEISYHQGINVERMRILVPKPEENRPVSRWQSTLASGGDTERLVVELDMTDTGERPFEQANRNESAATEAAVRFLRYCRVRTGQYQIDLRQEVGDYFIHVVNEDGVSVPLGGAVVDNSYSGVPPRLDKCSWEQVRNDVLWDTPVPLEVELVLDAQLYLKRRDFRMAALSAAIAVEAIVTSYIRLFLQDRLVGTGRANASQVDRFVNEMSNRGLSTIGLGLGLECADKANLENCKKALELRNSILHGPQRHVDARHAGRAVDAATWLLSLDEIESALFAPESWRHLGQ